MCSRRGQLKAEHTCGPVTWKVSSACMQVISRGSVPETCLNKRHIWIIWKKYENNCKKCAFISSVKRCTYKNIHNQPQSYWSSFQKFTRACTAGCFSGRIKNKNGARSWLERCGKPLRERKVLTTKLKWNKTNFKYLWLNKTERKHTHIEPGKTAA